MADTQLPESSDGSQILLQKFPTAGPACWAEVGKPSTARYSTLTKDCKEICQWSPCLKASRKAPFSVWHNDLASAWSTWSMAVFWVATLFVQGNQSAWPSDEHEKHGSGLTSRSATMVHPTGCRVVERPARQDYRVCIVKASRLSRSVQA